VVKGTADNKDKGNGNPRSPSEQDNISVRARNGSRRTRKSKKNRGEGAVAGDNSKAINADANRSNDKQQTLPNGPPRRKGRGKKKYRKKKSMDDKTEQNKQAASGPSSFSSPSSEMKHRRKQGTPTTTTLTKGLYAGQSTRGKMVQENKAKWGGGDNTIKNDTNNSGLARRRPKLKQEQLLSIENENSDLFGTIIPTLERETKSEGKIKVELEDNGDINGLINQLELETYSCAVCTDPVKKRASIWSCSRCFVIMHLKCVRKWAISTIPKEEDDGDTKVVDQSTYRWRCPACQYWVGGIPRASKCFCGKVKNPQLKSFLTPHACDKICGKDRGYGCRHRCNLPCHPGKCPPCHHFKKGSFRCACGKTEFKLRCGQDGNNTRLCGKSCNKTLPCFKHQCERKCHSGSCGQCPQKEEQQCFCGKEHNSLRPCGSGIFDTQDGTKKFSCGKVCGKLLACGKHRCTKTCHAGACSPCSRSPASYTIGEGEGSVKRKIKEGEEEKKIGMGVTGNGQGQKCACGQSVSYSPEHFRKTCTDPIWSCGKQCGKQLSCGHRCQSTCHDSSCPPCKIPVRVRCRCGMEEKMRPCQLQRRLLAGGKHHIKEKSRVIIEGKDHDEKWKDKKDDDDADEDDGGVFLCFRKCRSWLSCGRHKCNQKCCLAAQLAKEHPSHYLTHRCQRTCGKLLDCKRHSCPNPCHSGKCPPCSHVLEDGLMCPCTKTAIPGPITCGRYKLPKCNHPCAKIRDTCGHKCRSKCHPGPCPLCVELVSKTCAGGHTVMKAQVCFKPPPSCGRPCGRIRRCKNHRCDRSCHVGQCSEAKQITRGPLPRRTLTAFSRLLLPPDSKKKKKVKDAWGSSSGSSDDDNDDDDGGDVVHKNSNGRGGGGEVEEEEEEKVWSCGRKCGIIRGCGHRCDAICHPTHPCPALPCRYRVKISCQCGRITREVVCGFTKMKDDNADDDALNKRPAGAPTCDEICKKAERNRKLRLALDLDEDGKAANAVASLPFPADLLSLLSKSSPSLLSFMEKIEKTLEEFIKNDSSPSSTMWLPTMAAPKRWIVHCVAVPMSLEVESGVAIRLKNRRTTTAGRSLKITKSYMSTLAKMRISVVVT